MNTTPPTPKYMNPYLAGFLLGLTLLASFVILGTGLGASGGLARIAAFTQCAIAPQHTRASEYFGPWCDAPLRYYLLFMLVGTFLGGLASALFADRLHLTLERGHRASVVLRGLLAIVGGGLIGFASRLAAGCTSGQALTGGALLLTGSLVFLVCIFAGGYATAWFVRRQWND